MTAVQSGGGEELHHGAKPGGLYAYSQKKQPKSTLVEGREAGVNKPELVSAIAEKTGLNKRDSERVINAFVESIGEALAKGEKVSLVGFGTFEVRTRQARTGRNPRTGQTLTIPAAKVPAFKPGKQLRDLVK